MSIDLSALSPEAREAYIVVGRQFGSPDTVAQANQTLKGVAAHGTALAAHGFAAEDGARLADARDALVAAGADRVGAVGEKKITNATLASALQDGKTQRESARSILENTQRALTEAGGPAGKAGAMVIRTALQQTRSAGADGGKLAEQLDVLRGALSDPGVVIAATGRGGPAAVTALLDAASTLRAAAAERAGAAGTPAETERVDLLDGIIVALARGARKAAGSAAKRLGTPALMADFELTRLYGTRAAVKAEAPPGGGAPRGGSA
jgi:hypothetical protein